MGKETRIGLFVITLLLFVFSIVLYQRLKGPERPQAKSPARKQKSENRADKLVRVPAKPAAMSKRRPPARLASSHDRPTARYAGANRRPPTRIHHDEPPTQEPEMDPAEPDPANPPGRWEPVAGSRPIESAADDADEAADEESQSGGEENQDSVEDEPTEAEDEIQEEYPAEEPYAADEEYVEDEYAEVEYTAEDAAQAYPSEEEYPAEEAGEGEPTMAGQIPAEFEADDAIRQVTASGRTYLVEEGDTLFDVARNELGSASRWTDLYELNEDAVGDNFDTLPAGIELALPEP